VTRRKFVRIFRPASLRLSAKARNTQEMIRMRPKAQSPWTRCRYMQTYAATAPRAGPWQSQIQSSRRALSPRSRDLP
jgi:hypothetical protein